MAIEEAIVEQQRIERVKCTRVIDLDTLTDEDVRAFCAFHPTRFLDTLQQAWSIQGQHAT